jgi:hypothetical protein
MLRESKGLRYLWVEAPPEVPLSPFSSQYVLILLPGTSGRGTAQGTARTPEPPGYFASFDAFSGTSTGTSARGTARTRFSSDLNR